MPPANLECRGPHAKRLTSVDHTAGLGYAGVQVRDRAAERIGLPTQLTAVGQLGLFVAGGGPCSIGVDRVELGRQLGALVD